MAYKISRSGYADIYGPTRVSREDIQKFFAPELKERFFAVEEIDGLAEIVGASMAQGYYWFKRVSTDCY